MLKLVTTVFLCQLSFHGFALAKPIAVGQIVGIVGISHLNNQQVLKSQEIFLGSGIETSAGSSLSLILFPGLTLTLGPQTEVKIIGTLVKEEKGSQIAESAIKIIKGKISGRLSQTEIKQEVNIFSRRSISAVRGTEFTLSEDSDETELYVDYGKVDVYSGKNLEQVSVTNNAGVAIKDGSAAPIESSDLKAQKLSILPAEDIKKSWSLQRDNFLNEQKKYFSIISKKMSAEVQKYTMIIKKQSEEVSKFNKNQGIKTNDWIKKNIKSN